MILLFWISAPKFNRRCSCKILQEHILLCFGFTKHKQRSSVNVLKEVLLNRSRWLGSKCSNFLKTIWKKCCQSKKVNSYLFICLVQKYIVHMVNKIISLERILLLLEVNHLILFFPASKAKIQEVTTSSCILSASWMDP